VADARVFVAEGLLEWTAGGDGIRLIVSVCPKCRDVSFPRRAWCKNPDCLQVATATEHLEGTGRLVTYTVQHYPPPGPFGQRTPFVPIPIVLVEYDLGIGVLGQVLGWDGGEMRIGAAATLRPASLYRDERGRDVIGWGFELAGERRS